MHWLNFEGALKCSRMVQEYWTIELAAAVRMPYPGKAITRHDHGHLQPF